MFFAFFAAEVASARPSGKISSVPALRKRRPPESNTVFAVTACKSTRTPAMIAFAVGSGIADPAIPKALLATAEAVTCGLALFAL